MNTYLIVLSFLVNFSLCRDFYIGMFKRNDYLVAQDRLYRERSPFRYQTAKYGRLFKCPITFLRVVDRLGVGNGPRVQVTRGGLGKNYVTLLITSAYNYPISVNVYAGCSSVKITTVKVPVTSSEEQKITEEDSVGDKDEVGKKGSETTVKKDHGPTTVGKVEVATVAPAGNESAPNESATTTATS